MATPTRQRTTAYRRVADELRQLIDGGHPEGEPLPTENELAARYAVSRQTVRRAFLDLVAEELVYRVAGKGTFVQPADTRYRQSFTGIDDLLRLQTNTDMEITEPIHSGPAPSRVSAPWPEGETLELTLLRWHRGVVFCRTRIWLPASVGESLVEHPDLTTRGRLTRNTIIGLLEAQGITIHHAAQVTSACAAEDGDAALLGCPPGSPLLSITRTYLDRAGAPIEHAESVFVPQHYSHIAVLSRMS